MKKSLLVLAVPFFGLPLVGCNRSVAPTSIKIYGLSAAMKNNKYIFYADFGDKENIDRRVKWSVDKPEIATIDSNGILSVKDIGNDATITITAKSKKDEKLVDTKSVFVAATEGLSDIEFLYTLKDNERTLASKLSTEEPSKKATLAEGDYITEIRRKFIPKADTASFNYKRNKTFGDRIDGMNISHFTDTKEGSKIIVKKFYDYEHAEYISGIFESYKQLEEKGRGLYNCFRYTEGNKTIYGYYTFLFSTVESESEFTYREFNNDGYMITLVDGKGNNLTKNLHFTLAE